MPIKTKPDLVHQPKEATMYFYNNTELYHHGIKGQKWGVRRFQNKDGSLKPAGEKHRQALNDALFDRSKNADNVWKERDSKIKKIQEKYGHPGDVDDRKLYSFYYDKNHNRTKKSIDYLKEVGKIENETDSKIQKAYKKDDEAEEENWKTVENNKEMRSIMSDIKRTMNSISNIDDEISKKAEKEAFEEYKNTIKKKHPNDKFSDEGLRYGFDHEFWVPGNKKYDANQALINKQTKELNKQMASHVDRFLSEGLGQKKVKSLSEKQIESAKLFVDQRIRFRFDLDNDK